MNILFVHQNFPGQFKFLAPALAKLGHRVIAMTMQKTDAKDYQGVQLVKYSANRGNKRGQTPFCFCWEETLTRALRFPLPTGEGKPERPST